MIRGTDADGLGGVLGTAPTPEVEGEERVGADGTDGTDGTEGETVLVEKAVCVPDKLPREMKTAELKAVLRDLPDPSAIVNEALAAMQRVIEEVRREREELRVLEGAAQEAYRKASDDSLNLRLWINTARAELESRAKK